MTIIPITEFRRDTKTGLDKVKEDAIYISRGNELFKLSYSGTIQDMLAKSPAPEAVNVDESADWGA